jgi:hypothetical protein
MQKKNTHPLSAEMWASFHAPRSALKTPGFAPCASLLRGGGAEAGDRQQAIHPPLSPRAAGGSRSPRAARLSFRSASGAARGCHHHLRCRRHCRWTSQLWGAGAAAASGEAQCWSSQPRRQGASRLVRRAQRERGRPQGPPEPLLPYTWVAWVVGAAAAAAVAAVAAAAAAAAHGDWKPWRMSVWWRGGREAPSACRWPALSRLEISRSGAEERE